MDQREIFDSEHAVKADKTVSFEVAQNSVQFSGPMGESPAPPAVPTPAPSPTPSPTPASTTSRSTKGKKRGHSKFQTHELTVDPGGDVMVKIMSLSLQAPHAICILSANGTISKVTIRGRIPGETSTFEGIFKILSLNGSFIPLENELTNKRCGELNVWFELLNGDVIVGALAGLMIAAGHVKVLVGSFLPPGHTPGHTLEQKVRKQKAEGGVEHKSPHVNSFSAE